MGIQKNGEGFVIKKEINVGHVMTALAFLVSAVLAYGATQADIQASRYEAKLQAQELQSQIEKNTMLLDSMMYRIEKVEDQ